MKRLRVAVLCLAGLACSYLLKTPPKLRGEYPFHTNRIFDFTGFYVGAKLLGTSQMYDVGANLEMQQKVSGCQDRTIIYARPPLWAAVIKPFTLIPYRTALLAARLIAIASLIAFVCLWPTTPRAYAALAVCWLQPIWGVITHGQDVPLILVLITLAVIWHRERPMLAGAALALCFAKWHLLVFLPLLLLLPTYRRVLYGFLATAAFLVLASFLIMPDWMQVYYHGITTMPASSFNGRPGMMPNFFAMFHPLGWSQAATIMSMIIIGPLLWIGCRRLPFELALPIFVLGGVLSSFHANDGDIALTIPAMLAAAKYSPQARKWVIVALSPLGFIGYLAVNPIIFIAPCACGAALAIVALQPTMPLGGRRMFKWRECRQSER